MSVDISCSTGLLIIQERSSVGLICLENLEESQMLWCFCLGSFCFQFQNKVSSWKQRKNFSSLEQKTINSLKQTLGRTSRLKLCPVKPKRKLNCTTPSNFTPKIIFCSGSITVWVTCSLQNSGPTKISLSSYTLKRNKTWSNNWILWNLLKTQEIRRLYQWILSWQTN